MDKKEQEIMKNETKTTEMTSNKSVNRRQFLSRTAVASAGMILAPNIVGKAAPVGTDEIRVGLLGAGAQGQVLWDASQNIKGLRFMSVCDIWKKGNLKTVSTQMRWMKKRGHVGTPYTDYKEMFDKEKLDAVIVATPDFWHSEHACAAMEKGLDVYCEKEMSNTVEGARKMVETMKKTGKKLQIGHQRRSNPRYIYCYENLVKDPSILGRITTINGQWNRPAAACTDLGWKESEAIDDATLAQFGFKDMKQFRNWRWYKGLGGGPIVDLGSHQIDIYSWFLDAMPSTVMADGGVDYWTDHEWYDYVMAMYKFDTKFGPVRASYQTTTTNSSNGYFETFMGDEGSLQISEAKGRLQLYREAATPEGDWDKWVKKGLITKVDPVTKKETKAKNQVTDARETPEPPKYDVSAPELEVAYHQPHLENFFETLRGKATLNCPGEDGFKTAVMVLKVNEAVAAGKKLTFKPEDFEA
ncbi:MAG: Gfo/Idh/MocA family oxidoreductase [Phycisphaerae bacterium]|nr:Gfo/Idh/MocA family oxidoreductase [Phycisphaerae bacterium]